MKNHLLVSFLLSALGASAWNVGTEPTPASALIEEFTGIQCPNCPDGHAIANMLTALHPEDVYTVAVHAGYFANPGPAQPNFITETGTAIHDYFGVYSYPCGDVNRHDYGSGTILGRANWGAACREALKNVSPVNLWSASSYDPTSKKLTVDVEAYLTDNMDDPRLTVWLLQSEILGPQSGGGLGEEYPHRHMLRAKLTDDDFGDALGKNAKGEYFSRSIEYDLPEEINGVAVNPADIHLLCFVSESDGTIWKVNETRPETSGLEQTFSVSFSAPPVPIDRNYAFDYVEVFLHNHGGVELLNADFNITRTGSVVSRRWEGCLAPHSSAIVRVPLEGAWADAVDSERNRYAIRMMKANGIEVETTSITGLFYEIFEYPAELTVKIKTDVDAADNTWRILDAEGEVVKEFGPYPDGVIEEYTETVELEPGAIYALEVTDCWGDGVRHPLGSIRLYDKSDNLVAQVKEINDYGFRSFFRATETAGTEMTEARPEVTSTCFYDLSGRVVTSPADGFYIERISYSDGSVKTHTRFISK